MKSGYLRSTIITLGSFLFVITAVGAWSGPPGNPPNPNVAAPINVSATSQYKQGPLGINTNAAPGGGFEMVVGGDASLTGGLSAVSLLLSGKARSASTLNTDAPTTMVTKDYVDSKVGGDDLGDHTATQNLDMKNLKIVNLLGPTNQLDGANKAYVDSQIGTRALTTNVTGTIKGCHRVTASGQASGPDATASCAASEIVVGGGCQTASANNYYRACYPSADLRSWIAEGNGPGTIDAYAICCTINP